MAGGIDDVLALYCGRGHLWAENEVRKSYIRGRRCYTCHLEDNALRARRRRAR